MLCNHQESQMPVIITEFSIRHWLELMAFELRVSKILSLFTILLVTCYIYLLQKIRFFGLWALVEVPSDLTATEFYKGILFSQIFYFNVPKFN